MGSGSVSCISPANSAGNEMPKASANLLRTAAVGLVSRRSISEIIDLLTPLSSAS